MNLALILNESYGKSLSNFMMNQTIESVTASLFREYLYRNNCRSTLEAFDREVPRTSSAITNRLELAKVLHILKLIKANKHREKPYPSMAEMIVADLIAKASLRNPEICIEERQHSGEISSDGLIIKGTFSLHKSDPHVDKKKSALPVDPRGSPSSHIQSSDKASNSSISKARMLRNSHLKYIGKSSSTPYKEFASLQIVGSNPKVRENPVVVTTRPPSRQRNSYNDFESLKEDSESNQKVEMKIDHFPQSKVNVFKSSNSADGGLEFIDIEDDIDEELHKLDLKSLDIGSKSNNKSVHVVHREQLEDLTKDEAIKMREIIFGDAASVGFNPEWDQQSFTFNDTHGLEFGLVQHKGGPCGILAAVQALIIKHLKEHHNGDLSPSNGKRQIVLVKVLSSILWQAANYKGGNKCVKVCYNSGRSKFAPSALYRNDGITEKLQYSRCPTLASTEACVQEFLPQFQNTTGKGCILFVYSLVLSRGVAAIRDDFDEPASVLMANHGYCSQELVDLCMLGYSAQNVFNNIIDLDGKILKGVREPQAIGFLTLYEYYNVFEVGTYLKQAQSGIWVICSESHYSVLFSLSKGYTPDKTTELFYYDSLANQESLYKLTVSPNVGVESSDDDPPLELCIRTFWKNAKVDWNGSDPLL